MKRLEKAKRILMEGRIREEKNEVREFTVIGDSKYSYTVKLYPTGVMTCTREDGATCPDIAPYCKHKLAVMEGVNERLI